MDTMKVLSTGAQAGGFLTDIVNAGKGVLNLFGIGTGYRKAKKQAQRQFEYEKQLQELSIQQQKEANLELSDYSFDREVEMWNKQNEYNSPASQMARFKAAGLNPALMYGQGSPGNATSLPSYQAPQVSKAEYANPVELEMRNLSMYNNIAFQRAQISNLNALTAKTLAEVPNVAKQGNLIEYTINKLDAETKNAIQQYQHRVDMLPLIREAQQLSNKFANGELTTQSLQQNILRLNDELTRKTLEKVGKETENLEIKNALDRVAFARESYFNDNIMPLLYLNQIYENGILLDKNKINEATFDQRVQEIKDRAAKAGVDLSQGREILENLEEFGTYEDPGWKILRAALGALPIVKGVKFAWKSSRKVNKALAPYRRKNLNSPAFSVGLDSFINNK